MTIPEFVERERKLYENQLSLMSKRKAEAKRNYQRWRDLLAYGTGRSLDGMPGGSGCSDKVGDLAIRLADGWQSDDMIEAQQEYDRAINNELFIRKKLFGFEEWVRNTNETEKAVWYAFDGGLKVSEIRRELYPEASLNAVRRVLQHSKDKRVIYGVMDE